MNRFVVGRFSTHVLAALLLCLPVIGAAQSTASPPTASAPTAAPSTNPAPATRNVNRPPLEGSSYDIGQYEVKEIDGKPDLRFLGPAKEIEAKIGNTFGFIWSARGFTGTRLVPIRTVTKHPPFIPKGKTEPTTIHEEKVFFKPINGTTNWPYLYKFDGQEELVPGEWILSVYYDNELLAEHSFTVVATKR